MAQIALTAPFFTFLYISLNSFLSHFHGLLCKSVSAEISMKLQRSNMTKQTPGPSGKTWQAIFGADVNAT